MSEAMTSDINSVGDFKSTSLVDLDNNSIDNNSNDLSTQVAHNDKNVHDLNLLFLPCPGLCK